MVFAYIDAAGDVLSIGTTAVDLATVQVELPTVTTRIDNAPSEVIAKGRIGKLFYHQKASGDGSDISHYIQVPHLNAYKQFRYEQIDKKDEVLIKQGFTHNGQVFSLSNNAQKTWLMLHQMRTLLPYPFNKTVLDDSLPSYTIANQAELETMAATILGTVNVIISSGDALKDSIRAATTKGTIDLIADTR